MPIKILITSIGSLVAQNVLDSLEGRRESLHIVGTNSIVDAANNFRCDKAYLVPPAAETTDYVTALLSIIENEEPRVVIPGRDDDVVILSSLKRQLPKFSSSFMLGEESFARAMDDKAESYRFARKYDLPFSPTIASGIDASDEVENLLTSFGFPLIAKPTKGYGSRGIWIVTNQQQLDNVIQELGYVIQPLFGVDSDLTIDTRLGLPFFWEVPENNLFAAQVIIDPDGAIVDAIGFVSTMVVGKCERLSRCTDPQLIDIAQRFAKAAIVEGWCGPFNLQLKKDRKHSFQAIEMNGRFSGGTSARFHLGFDEVGLLINLWAGSNVVEDLSEKEGTDLVTKILSDFPIRTADMHRMMADKVWTSSR